METTWIPYTYEEHMLMVNVFEKIPDAEIAEPVTFTGISNGKRTTEKQASLYDAMIAEIYAERDGEKARVRNRRKNDRKYKELPKERKHIREMRKDKLFGYYGNYDCPKVVGNPDSLMIAERKRISAEIVIRKDYELELCDMEIEESFRKMDDAIKAEHLRNLHEWLKYA